MKYIGIIILVVWQSAGYSQISFGVKAGTTYSKFTQTQGDGTTIEISKYGYGAFVAGLIDYKIDRHKLQAHPGILWLSSPYRKQYIVDPFLTKNNFYFMECPLIYSYEVIPKFEIGIGINNAILFESDIGLAHDIGKKPYLFGIIGDLEIRVIDRLSIGASYRQIGLFQDKDGYREYFSFGLDARWRF